MPRIERRFAFGKNWAKYLDLVDDQRIEMARQSLQEVSELESLRGLSFVDIGSGSGLFSLAAAQLDAGPIESFDFDELCVACTQELKTRYFPGLDHWRVQQGDVLDDHFVRSLGQYDLVYSWGVLHHTGNMWEAFANVASMVAPGGLLFLSIYNDQGRRSRFWRSAKRTYCSGVVGRAVVLATMMPWLVLQGLKADTLQHRNPVWRYTQPRGRGMSVWRDMIDWLGGYPFEVATSDSVSDFFAQNGFRLLKMATAGGGSGCNQFVFQKVQRSKR